MESPTVVVIAGLLLAAGTACGPTRATQAAPAAAGLPPYTAGQAALFGDSFSKDFFGLERTVAPGDDAKLRARVREADSVLVARINTVTRDTDGAAVSYQLVLLPAQTLAGSRPPSQVAVSVDAASPSFAYVQSADADLVGKTVIVFVKRYNQKGVVTLHWHVEADVPPVRQAVERAKLL